ncbi:MAG: class I SAM-dependent methyltransferase [Luteolibacter sp.]|jgi:SAM-dependent MidA family methyltransferase|nr:class I SAM-dependent methyltransferase [Luteolibacter sp.]
MNISGISDKSCIPFEEFMRRALHDPIHGYYARRIRGIGTAGDFTTTPMLSEAPARAIAAWAVRALRETRCRDLIEIGPGEGMLAAAVRKHLPWQVRWNTQLHLVETSAPLANIQQQALGARAVWHTTPAKALAACRGRAVIFSNELVDAFPVRRFQYSNECWRELAVAFGPGGAVIESLLPPAPLPDSSAFSQQHPPGQWIEVHDSYRHWLLDWLPLWQAGRMLTIDYGSSADFLYQRRPRGTLRAYLLQQRLEGPAIYQNPSRQDLTADVNFTDLIDWSAPWVAGSELQTMAAFLKRWQDSRNPVDSTFNDEQGAGGAFLALDQTCAGPGT